MNVLMIGPSREVHGGISGVVNNLIEAGLDQKVNLKYIGTMEEGTKLHKLFVAIRAYLIFCLTLRKADIVHVNMASDTSFYRKAIFIRTAKKAGKKLVIHQHGGNFSVFYSELDAKKQAYVRTVLNMASEFWVLFPAYADFFRDIITSCDVKVMPNTIKVGAYPDKEAKRKHSVVFLGRICEAKGITELLDAVKQLKESFSDLHVYLGGIFEDTSYKEHIDEMADCVTYVGWLEGEAKYTFLDESDIFVLPSYFEGQPVSILEAMAHGCTVVATDVGGIPMMIEDSETGVLVEAKNSKSLADGLHRVLADDDFKDTLRNNAYRSVKEYYSIDKTIDELVKMYSFLME